MAGVNKVILVGHIGRDPESRQVGTQTKSSFSLATSRTWTDKQGQRQESTQWHRVICWGKLADQVVQLGAKGRLVYVEGSLETREYEANSEKQRVTEVNARTVEFLTKREDGGGREASPPAQGQSQRHGGYAEPSYGADPSDQDIPF